MLSGAETSNEKHSAVTERSRSETREKFKIDFVGIGASKCGTTWLGHVLEEHPQICMSEPKEVNFFNDIQSFRTKHKRRFHKGFSWYRNFFKHCNKGKYKGEITNYYGIDPVAAIRLKEHNPDLKILFCMRNPVDRIWSHYQFAKYFEKKEKRPVETAIKEENQYIRMSLYAQTLSLYLKHFHRDQIFLLWFEDIYKRPEELLHDIFIFLGVDPAFRPKSMYKKSNPARASHYAPLQFMIRRFNMMLALFGLSGVVKKLKMAGLADIVMNMTSRPIRKESIPEEVKQYILLQVKDDVQRLESMTGKDLSQWNSE